MAPSCSRCRADAVGFVVPDALRPFTAFDADQAVLCRVCLTLDPTDAPAVEEGVDLTVVSEAFPTDAEAAAAVAVLLGLLESLALHRQDIQAVIDLLEAEGVDALLVLDRLADDPALRPAVDLDRRIHQLDQLLE